MKISDFKSKFLSDLTEIYTVEEVTSLFRIVLEELLSFDITKFYLKPDYILNKTELDKVIKNIKKKYGNKKIGLFNSLLTYETMKKFKITWINITFRDRKFGKTKHGSLKMLMLLFNLIFNLK